LTLSDAGALVQIERGKKRWAIPLNCAIYGKSLNGRVLQGRDSARVLFYGPLVVPSHQSVSRRLEFKPDGMGGSGLSARFIAVLNHAQVVGVQSLSLTLDARLKFKSGAQTL
jgi:hypothetical protein